MTGADDARRAAWIPAANHDCLVVELALRCTGTVFAAHTGMLRRFLAG